MTTERIGIILGIKPSNPLEFWVGVQEGHFVQLDEVLFTETDMNGEKVKFYGTVHEVAKFLEGVEFVYDAQLVGKGMIPANTAYIARVAVTRIEPEVFIPPSPGDPVFRAKGKELEKAMYYDSMKRKIPAGISRTGDVVYINYDFINGREGAHISISGMSGVATKTSYALFLMYSILKKADDRKNIHGIIFNVKGKDLFWIDKKNKNFGEDDREKFLKMGLDPNPFTEVVFYSPPEKEGSNVPSVKERLDDVKVYRWSVYEFAKEGLLRFLFAEGDEGVSTLNYVIDRVTERLYHLAKQSPPGRLIDEFGRDIESLEDLRERLREYVETAKDRGDTYKEWFGTASLSTVYAFLRRLDHAITHTRNLIHGHVNNPIDWRERRLTVIDISDLHSIGKMFVVGSILKKIFKEKEESGNPYPKIFVVLDELNKYAPRDRWSPIKDILLDIAERGRSLGVILIGAQQTASEVEKRIIANAAVKVTGRLDSTEVMNREYEYLIGNFRQRAMMLKKGSMILYQPDIPNPIMINFPFAPWATRKEEVEEDVAVPEDFHNF